jgi:hypothetical protein
MRTNQTKDSQMSDNSAIGHIDERRYSTVRKQVTWGQFSKVYQVANGLEGELDAISKFRKDFANQIPPYKVGTRVSSYMRKFSVTSE